MNKYYVYKIKSPESMEVIYVGKGSGPRAYRQIWNVIGRDVVDELYCLGRNPLDLMEIHRDRLVEAEAFKIEGELVQHYREQGFELLNKKQPPRALKWRQKLSESNRGKHNHCGENNPNAKACILIESGEVFSTLKELCQSAGYTYQGVKSSLAYAKKHQTRSKYHNTIKFINNE